MTKSLIISILIVLLFNLSNAQSYEKAIGIRGGLFSGITGKFFLSDNTAIEGIFHSRWKGYGICGLYEIHNDMNNENFRWYYGAGGSLSVWEGQYVPWIDPYTGHDIYKQYMVISIDGIIGIEYNFSDIPFNLSIDWKPSFNLVGYSGLWVDGAALSLRYTF